MLLRAMALSNDAYVDAAGAVYGDPTETALWQFAREKGFDKAALEKTFPRIAELPFDSERKMMTTLHRCADGSIVAFTKGAMESDSAALRRSLPAGQPPAITALLHAAADELAGAGPAGAGVCHAAMGARAGGAAGLTCGNAA